MRSVIIQTLLSLTLAVLAAVTATPTALAEDVAWVIKLEPQQMPQLLNYPGSKLRPLVRVAVTSRDPNNADKRDIDVPYEDLFFSSYRAIGCRRHAQLSIGAGTQGIVDVSSGPFGLNSTEESAICGGIVRLMLDINLHRCAIKRLVVPDGSYETIVSGLAKYGIRPAPPLTTNAPVIAVAQFTIASKSGKHVSSLIYGGG